MFPGQCSLDTFENVFCKMSAILFNTQRVNTLRPKQNGRHFADDIFKYVFLNENVWIPIKISPKFVPKGGINNIPALVKIMAWRRPGDKPLSEPMMVSLLTHICVTRPQWVKSMYRCHFLSAETREVASDYLPSTLVIRRQSSSVEIAGRAFIDENNNTCVPVMLSGDRLLQAVFTFPNSNISHQMSVEIILKNVEDCRSPAWVWFVESQCTPAYFQECSLILQYRRDNYAICLVSCFCPISCDYLYVKYNWVPFMDQEGHELCEVSLLGGPVEPTLKTWSAL